MQRCEDVDLWRRKVGGSLLFGEEIRRNTIGKCEKTNLSLLFLTVHACSFLFFPHD